jgi:16S rRNA processing protein RimM
MDESRVRNLARFSRVRDSALPPAEPPELITVGKVGKPHGLDGSFVVEDASEDPQRFEPGATLLVEGDAAEVVERKRAGGRLVVRLDRPVDRGTPLQISRADLPQPKAGEYYVFQLVGLDVEEEGGRALGTVTEVAPGVANDVLELDTGLSLPLVEACVREVDLERRRILVAPGFTFDN